MFIQQAPTKKKKGEVSLLFLLFISESIITIVIHDQLKSCFVFHPTGYKDIRSQKVASRKGASFTIILVSCYVFLNQL
jgi:hypothetical protein